MIQKVRERADITQIVGEVVSLKRAGASLKGLCPFHGEKTPSFVVNPQQGTYHCFGCQAHGDALTFIKETQNLNFPEAVKALASRVGIEIVEERPLRPEQREQRIKKRALEDRLFEAQELLTQWYELNLSRSSVAQSYLNKREITQEAARTFRLGWASDDVAQFMRWVRDKKIDLDDLITLGVVIPFDPEQPDKRGDNRLNGGRLRFRNRVMCPIFDIRDRVVGYSGRVIDPKQKIAKYLNSPETPIFTKSDHLFGLKSARIAMRSNKVKYLILCEGNLDVISLWQAGFPNTVAAMGTALSDRQANLIKRLSSAVVCVMDGDDAGQAAAFKSLPVLLSQGLDVRGKLLPKEQDPDSFIRTYGAKSFKDWLVDAQPLILVKLKSIAKEHPKDPIGQAAMVKAMLPLIQMIKDPHQRPLFLDSMAKEIGVDRSYLSEQLVRQYAQNTNSSFSDSKGFKAQQATQQHRANETAHSSQGSNSRSTFDGQSVSKGNKPFKKELKDRPWWANVTIQRGSMRAKSRQFGDRPKGEADLKIESAPQPPSSLQASEANLSNFTLFGYEREAISTLFYSPSLLNLFLERGHLEYFTHQGIQNFLVSLKKERDEGRFATGEGFFEKEQDQSLVAALKDCIAHPPIQDEKIDQERALNDLSKRLRLGLLQSQLNQTVAELKQLSQTKKSHDLKANDVLNQRRQQLLESYQNTQAKLQELLHPPQTS